MVSVRKSTFAFALLAAACSAVAAAEPSDDPSRLASFCHPGKAFGITFGAGESKGLHMSAMSTLVTLSPEFLPFDNAEVVVSLRTRRRHTVHGEADFLSSFDAEDVLARIKAALIARGWVAPPASEVIENADHLYSQAAAWNKVNPKGLAADLFTTGTRLYFSCSDVALRHRARKEFPSQPAAAPR